jgi:hypothetical protein
MGSPPEMQRWRFDVGNPRAKNEGEKRACWSTRFLAEIGQLGRFLAVFAVDKAIYHVQIRAFSDTNTGL